MTMQPSDLRRLRALAEENEILREQVRQLREALMPSIPLPRAWKLSPGQSRLLRALRSAGQGVLYRERAMTAIYVNADDTPSSRIVDAFVCHLRRALSKHAPAIEIETIKNVGYRLRPEGIAAFDAAVAIERAAYDAALADAPFQYGRAA